MSVVQEAVSHGVFLWTWMSVVPEAVSHGVFLSRGNELWAFHDGSFSGRLGNVHTRGYVRNEQTGKWNARGIVAEASFWPMQRPRQLANGNWIMSGISVHTGPCRNGTFSSLWWAHL